MTSISHLYTLVSNKYDIDNHENVELFYRGFLVRLNAIKCLSMCVDAEFIFRLIFVGTKAKSLVPSFIFAFFACQQNLHL